MSFGAQPSFFPDFTPASTLGTNIGDIALRCHALLQKCLNLPHLKEDEWAENRLAEFSLWTATSGVFAGDRASLDARLALQPEVISVFISLLTILNDRLTKCQNFGTAEFTAVNDEFHSTHGSEEDDEEENKDAESEVSESEDEPTSPEHGLVAFPEDIPRAFSPWSDDSDLSTDLDQHSRDAGSPVTTKSSLDGTKIDVTQVIDHLARLTLAIRKAGTSSRAHKADRRFNADDQPSFRRHLNVVVLARGMEEGRSDHTINPNNLTAIQDRLITANLLRRNRFLYSQRHARKLATEVEPQNAPQGFQLGDDMPIIVEDKGEPKPEEEIIPEPGEQVSEAIEAPAQVVVETVAEPLSKTQPPILSATSASGMTRAIDPGFIHNVTPSRFAKTEITTTSAKIVYPKPPAMPLGMHFFKCPCCCQALPEMYRQPSLWKKHLMTDIAPYTCIIEDCPTPDRLFVTRAEWDQHTRNDHQKCWQCLPCSPMGKAPLVFPSVEAFMEHLRVVHSDTINEEQYSTLVPESARPVPTGISCCPMCNSNGPADSPVLFNHIAEHLHSFALRSLPWPGRESLHTDFNEQDDNPDNMDDGDDDDAESYFLYNDYFDQGSDIASRQYNLTSGSNRDSDGLPSLHSSQASERPATPSDKGSEVADATSPPPDDDAVVEPGEPLPIIQALYDTSKGTPIELVASADSVPEVVQGEWPQECARGFPLDIDDPETIRLKELMLNRMQMNYKWKVHAEGPESQDLNRIHHCMADGSPNQDFLAKVVEFEAQGNLTEAILWQKRAVDHFRDALGFAHHFVIENIDKLAEMHWDASDKKEADYFLSKEVNIFIEEVGIHGSQDPTWTINGAYNLATLEDGTQHIEAAREKYLNFLKDQNRWKDLNHWKDQNRWNDQKRWKEIVVIERNSVARVNADLNFGPDTTQAADALSRLAHALRQIHQTQEAAEIEERIKAIRLFGQDTAPEQREALKIFERIRQAEIRTLGPWNPASLPTLICLFRFYSHMGLSDDAIDVVQEIVICNTQLWSKGHLASSGKELTDYYWRLFDWKKAEKALNLYDWLKPKDFYLMEGEAKRKPYLELGLAELGQRAPRSFARPDMAAGLPIAELADTCVDYGSSAPSDPANEAPSPKRRSVTGGFSKALRFWRRDKTSDKQ
ncbi:transcription factor Zn, C2H2 [Metarhizium guizhouense ARSEF 977]|uniref:Transcription factor Zn, C2H2 n=1 Tax=Metarhizium guizhouense (strain ARSEF 977) TaxID=1276136 RepID=A0A0B4GND6_METGA|nr:transcription factor Zn, C2H2 [Metarhizium guizhouense ARSEF 977]